MITKTIKTTSGPLKISIPNDIKEISIGKLMELTPVPGHSFSELEQLEQLSILSGIGVDIDWFKTGAEDEICLLDICNMDDLRVFDEALQTIAYQLKHFVTVQEIPKQISFELPTENIKRWFNRNTGNALKIVPVISNLGIAPAGAYLEAKQLIKKEYERWEKVKEQYSEEIEFNPSIEAQIRLLSLYFYVPATGNKFNTLKVIEFDEVIKKLPITQALPIARYFFLRYPNLSKEKLKPSIKHLKQLRAKQV